MTTLGSFFSTAADGDERGTDNSNGSIHAKNLEIHAILSQRFNFPPEVTEQILDSMENWLSAGSFGFGPLTTPLRVQDGEKLIVETPQLSLREVRNLRKIVISLTSKDQGWSSYPQFHGTFDGSHSWWNYGIERLEAERVPSAGDAARALSKPLGEEENGISREPSSLRWVEVRKRAIQYNRHAAREMESHMIELDHDHEIFEYLQAGDRMILSASARYPGWCNYVQQAELELFFKDNLG